MMNDAPLEEIKRGEHRVARWITMLWLAFVVTLALAAIVMAVRLNCDLVRTLGFLAASSMLIFTLSAVAYLALYGLSVLLEGLDYHKTHCDDSSTGQGWRTSCDDRRSGDGAATSHKSKRNSRFIFEEAADSKPPLRLAMRRQVACSSSVPLPDLKNGVRTVEIE